MMERWRDGDEQRFDRDAHRGPNGIASERHVWSHCPLKVTSFPGKRCMSHAQAQLQLGWGWEIRSSNWSGIGSGSFTPYSTLGGRLGSW